MARKGRGKAPAGPDPAAQSFQVGMRALREHPMFAPLAYRIREHRAAGNLCPADGWAVATPGGIIHAHATRRADPQEWLYVLAHCLLHYGMNHFQGREKPREWNAACDCVVSEFLAGMKLGRTPVELGGPVELPARTEEKLYAQFCAHGIPPELQGLGTGGRRGIDMADTAQPPPRAYGGKPADWQDLFGQGLVAAVSRAVDVAGGKRATLGGGSGEIVTASHLAKRWFLSSFPLLGSLAAGFKVIEDAPLCTRMRISVAAVSAEAQEIYVNPAAGLNEPECRFVMAHELLHVGLSHHARRQGREPYLWNVACDFVINQWLIEMGVGSVPRFGLLYDPELQGLSAEAIYDRIVTDARRFRKVATLRGVGVGDILPDVIPDWWAVGEGMTLDAFYRRCLGQGLAYQDDEGRGLLPAGLVEEIRALAQPPVPWDVELARWFDDHFQPVERVRSYARLSRRQSSTPDIPRPRWVPKPGAADGRTFGVLLDTSGSMDRALLAKALGAIASYGASRDVPAARVVFCDAVVYDQGYMPPESIAGRVRIRGRGGTVLQPGIDLLEKAGDFPKDGPILVITDGACDRLRIAREHAFLLPEGRHLPFPPRGKVFRIR